MAKRISCVIMSFESPFADQDHDRAAFCKSLFDDFMEIGTRVDGVDVEKYLLAELGFEVIYQSSGMTGAIGASVADKYSYVLAGFQERHITLQEDYPHTENLNG
jgi:hypothetical protein